jgi:hypothetical protein
METLRQEIKKQEGGIKAELTVVIKSGGVPNLESTCSDLKSECAQATRGDEELPANPPQLRHLSSIFPSRRNNVGLLRDTDDFGRRPMVKVIRSRRREYHQRPHK